MSAALSSLSLAGSRLAGRRNAWVRPVIVLVAVDAPGLLVLLPRQGVAVLSRQVAVVLRAHAMLFAIDALLLAFQMPGFAGRQLPVAHTLPDALLLVSLTLCDVMAFRRCGLCRRAQRKRKCKSSNPGAQCKDLTCHDDVPFLIGWPRYSQCFRVHQGKPIVRARVALRAETIFLPGNATVLENLCLRTALRKVYVTQGKPNRTMATGLGRAGKHNRMNGPGDRSYCHGADRQV